MMPDAIAPSSRSRVARAGALAIVWLGGLGAGLFALLVSRSLQAQVASFLQAARRLEYLDQSPARLAGQHQPEHPGQQAQWRLRLLLWLRLLRQRLAPASKARSIRTRFAGSRCSAARRTSPRLMR